MAQSFAPILYQFIHSIFTAFSPNLDPPRNPELYLEFCFTPYPPYNPKCDLDLYQTMCTWTDKEMQMAPFVHPSQCYNPLLP